MDAKCVDLQDPRLDTYWTIRACSQLALALIAQTARDLLLPVEMEPGLTRWQRQGRRQNAVHKHDAQMWVRDQAGSACMSLARCCDVINAVLGDQSLHIHPDALRKGLLHYPEYILRWAAEEKETVSKQRRERCNFEHESAAVPLLTISRANRRKNIPMGPRRMEPGAFNAISAGV